MHRGAFLYRQNCTFDRVAAKSQFEYTEMGDGKAAQRLRHGVQKYNDINAYAESITLKHLVLVL